MIGSPRRLVAFLVARADAARDAGRFADAAALYREALELAPRRAGILIQRGHMLKELGDLADAEAHYERARRLRPRDADLALQRGHLFKTAGRLAEAHAAYAEAAALKPGWDEPARELGHLRASGWRGLRADADADAFDHPTPVAMPGADRWGGRGPAKIARLVPALTPRRPEDLLHRHDEAIEVRGLGRREAGYWGHRRTLRGVEAVRGFCIAEAPIVEVQVILNALAIHRGPVRGGYPLINEPDQRRCLKYVFNVWLDFAVFAHGLHNIEVRVVDARGRTRSFHDEVVIAAPVPEADHPRSNVSVAVDRYDGRPIDVQIKARPSMVQPARRVLFPDGVRNVAVMRTDQLGDMIASIPAMRRLREIVPDARIVGLLTAANADLARTLDLFDEIVVIDFPDDWRQRRRVMTFDEQDRLRVLLAPHAFDIAIDLAQSNVSRALLPLTGAGFLYGTGGGDWPWLSAEIVFNTRDRWNAMDVTPHSTKVLALVEALGAILRTEAPIIRRADLTRAMLAPYGIGARDRYALLHAGARIPFSRWPHYAALAARLLAETALKVVFMSEDDGVRETIPPELLADPRLLFLDKRLSFDVFDAFVSFATIVVGNDSGPKHLAALRGVEVVTLFTARINWMEWGQEEIGAIISRRVPCAGCALFFDAEECGQDFTCIRDIRVNEVFATMTRLMDARGETAT